MPWKSAARREPAGFYRWRTERGEVRIFMTDALFADEVIRAVTEAGLAEVEVRLLPIASIKGND